MSEIVTREQKAKTIRELLSRESIKSQIAMVAPKHLTPDRIVRIAMTSIQRTPKLLDCTWQSLLSSLLTCTQLGLEPDSVSGLAYLVPYGKVCTLIVGYRGLMALARRSGEILTLDARIVYERDEFAFEYGANPTLSHKWDLRTTDRGKPTGGYAVAKLHNGAVQFDVMSVQEIDAIRNRSAAAKSGPWVTDWGEMGRKTPMRRLCKYLPSSPELQRAVMLDEQAERGIPQDLMLIDIEAEPSVPATEQSKTLDDVMKRGEEPQPDVTATGSGRTVVAQQPQNVGTASEPPEPPPAAESAAQADPGASAASGKPIGKTSDLYGTITKAYYRLTEVGRGELRTTLGINTITTVGTWDVAAANNVLDKIEAKLAETA